MRGVLHITALNLLRVLAGTLIVANDCSVLTSFEKPLE